jgi:hypothetical protein
MNENELDQQNLPDQEETTIHVNEYGDTKDPAVVVDEPGRTVLLTPDETIVVEKQARIDIVPVNRPRKVYGGMWGQMEIAAVCVTLLGVLAVILFYVFVVIPSGRELEANRIERDRLEAEMTLAKQKYGDIASTETQVAKLVSSVQDFESRFLPVASTGRSSLYQRVNGLIAAYGLVNTTGPDYSPLELADAGKDSQSDTERGRAKYRSVFPGVYITMTVEGPYQNLRRFIRELETGGDFIAISAIELEPSDSDGKTDSVEPQERNSADVGQPDAFSRVNNPNGIAESRQQVQRPRGRTLGQTVALRLEMAAYFRRPETTSAVVTEQ